MLSFSIIEIGHNFGHNFSETEPGYPNFFYSGSNLNPLRAGLVERPEDYRWNSLRYHLQTENKDQFLSTDFGLEEFNPPKADKCLKSRKELIRKYRRYVYDAGVVNYPDKMHAGSLTQKCSQKSAKRF